MRDIIKAANLAVASIFVPGMFGIFLFSLIITIIVLILFVVGASTVTGWLLEDWVDSWLGYFAGGLGSMLLAWALFPGIMPIIVNFYDSKIAGAIEKQYYPDSLPSNETPWVREAIHDLKFSLKAILLNILALPFYLIPVVNIIIFYWMNGYLLGKEFFVMVARRYMPIEKAEAYYRTKSRTILIGGMLLTLCATIPFVNFVAPFWGIALMTHLFHQYRKNNGTMLDITN